MQKSTVLTQSSNQFVPTSWVGQEPPTETSSEYSLRCFAESRHPCLYHGPDETAERQRAIVEDASRLMSLVMTSSDRPLHYPAEIDEASHEPLDHTVMETVA